mgnify:FL=1
MQKRAFTLTELLIALGIIGTIAALSIPSLMTSIHNKMLATQLQNNVESVQQAIANQKIIHNTKDLTETKFKDETGFFSLFQSSKGEKCSAKSTTKCWGKSYRVIGGGAPSYELVPEGNAIRLKNGATIAYKTGNGDAYGNKQLCEIFIDVNGADEPNIVGRDLFAFFISKNGTISGNRSVNPGTCDTPSECFNALVKNNYNVPDDKHYYNTDEHDEG